MDPPSLLGTSDAW